MGKKGIISISFLKLQYLSVIFFTSCEPPWFNLGKMYTFYMGLFGWATNDNDGTQGVKNFTFQMTWALQKSWRKMICFYIPLDTFESLLDKAL